MMAPAPARERIACPDCGLVQVLPALARAHVAECARCDAILATRALGRVDAPLALTLAAAILLIPAMLAPLMTVSSFGARRASWLPSGVRTLWSDGFPSLGAVVAAFSVAVPCLFVTLLIGVMAGLQSGRARPFGILFRWVKHLRPWMMLEVYLLGCFVAYSRIEAITVVEIGVGGWCLLAATLVLLLALTQLDERTVWQALPIRVAETGTRTLPCSVCNLVVTRTEEGRPCPRCGAALRLRKRGSVRRTTALVLAGYLLYIPANVLPVLTIIRFGREESNTLVSGVLELARTGLWPLAAIVFLASIVVPLLKLTGLTWMLLTTHQGSRRMLAGRTWLYRTIDAIGRWSTIDVFMASVLVALLRFGALTEVRVAGGLVAFAAVVIVTMIASRVFDPRLMWDAPDARDVQGT